MTLRGQCSVNTLRIKHLPKLPVPPVTRIDLSWSGKEAIMGEVPIDLRAAHATRPQPAQEAGDPRQIARRQAREAGQADQAGVGGVGAGEGSGADRARQGGLML